MEFNPDLWLLAVETGYDPVADIPVESRFKYGREWDDDLSDVVAALRGDTIRKSDSSNPANVQAESEIDEDFLGTLGNPANHYGK